MLSVLYIVNESSLGGAAQSLLDMLKGVVKKNIKPVVVIPRKGIIEDELKKMEIPYYIIGFSNGYGKVGVGTQIDEDRNFLDNFEGAVQLQEIIKRERIQLIHINSSVSNIGAFAAIMADIPYIWHFRELLEEDFGCEFWDIKLKKQLIKYADEIITISDFVRKNIGEKYGITSVRVYDGLDIERYKNELSPSFMDKKGNGFLIVGNITENKGQWDAIHAARVLIGEGWNDFRLTIVGNGSARFLWMLKKIISFYELDTYIKIVPFQNDLSQFRQENQYAITTSKMEALGRGTIEAMLAGNVVIGADTGGTLEIIGESEERGFLYKQGDYVDLAKVMKKVILEDNSKKNECIHLAQDYAITTFDIDKYADEMAEIYNKVIFEYSVGDNKEKEYFLNSLKGRYSELNKINAIKKVIKEDKNRNGRYILIYAKWEEIRRAGYNISKYFTDRKVSSIAIYGMGNLGCRLFNELEKSQINIKYVVDRDICYLSEFIEVRTPDESLDNVDMLIVAVAKEENEIISYYRKRCKLCVIGLSEILESFYI